MADSDRTPADVPAMLAARPPKRGRPGRIAPEPVAVPIEADIAAVTLLTPPAPEPVSIPHPTAAVPAEPTNEETDMATPDDTMTAAAETATSKGAQVFTDMNDRAKGMMERAPKIVEDMAELGRGNVEAMVESGRIAARGMEAIGRHTADYARRQLDDTAEAFRTMTAVKSPTDLLRVQGELARTAFDRAVAEASRTTETMLKLAGEVAQPLSNRVAVVASRMKAAA